MGNTLGDNLLAPSFTQGYHWTSQLGELIKGVITIINIITHAIKLKKKLGFLLFPVNN